MTAAKPWRPDYWTKLAGLIKDQLDPSLRVYVEWSNEVWNGGFPVHAWAAGQAAWTGPCDAHMTALGDSTINPNGTRPDVYAIAPYFSGTSIQELPNAISTVTQWTTDSKGCASGGGLPLISYEGGSDSYAAGSGCTTLQHDAGMHDLYTSYLSGISGAGMTGPFMRYTHTGACWGLKEKTSDALSNSPKTRVSWTGSPPIRERAASSAGPRAPEARAARDRGQS